MASGCGRQSIKEEGSGKWAWKELPVLLHLLKLCFCLLKPEAEWPNSTSQMCNRV